jgi:hypothetical protein
MKRSGFSDLPLHGGKVPPWLYDRMSKLGLAMVEVIVAEHGVSEFLSRISDPFWFQSFGAVLGMDWHSSGITTSVMGALKKAINPRSNYLGLYVCGGRGSHSRATPGELMKIAERTGLDGHDLIRSSKLSAKIDNTAVQDGFQLYLHSFVLSNQGEWSVVQQGMHSDLKLARRYHWHSARVKSFVSDPHTSIVGGDVGEILNMVDPDAAPSRQGVLDVVHSHPAQMLGEIPYLRMPDHHEVRVKDVDLKRLGSMLYQAYDADLSNFESLLLLKGMGPRTLQSLALVSEVIYGTPTRFKDPARFSFAHGGKDGHPFPLVTQIYDETIQFLNDVVVKSKIARSEKLEACRTIFNLSKRNEQNLIPDPSKFDDYLDSERLRSLEYGGRTVLDDTKRADHTRSAPYNQLELF